jgi:hypothetical protein
METEKVFPSQAARLLGLFSPNYISMIKNKKYWSNCPASAWETVQLWVVSGKPLLEYAKNLQVKSTNPAQVQKENKMTTPQIDAIAKTRISQRLVEALASEQVFPSQASRILDLHSPAYISMIKNQKQWDKCPATAWGKVHLWIMSGKTLKEYADKQGVVLVANKPGRKTPEKSINTIGVSKTNFPDETAQKEVKTEAQPEIALKIIDELLKQQNEIHEALDLLTKNSIGLSKELNQKVNLEIEINLVISLNGNRINIG